MSCKCFKLLSIIEGRVDAPSNMDEEVEKWHTVFFMACYYNGEERPYAAVLIPKYLQAVASEFGIFRDCCLQLWPCSNLALWLPPPD